MKNVGRDTLVMDSQRFWTLIDDARDEAGARDAVALRLIDNLASMDIESILRWSQYYDVYQRLSYKMKLWAAAYVINGGCSDDGFEYFRGWLISRGQRVFLMALANPDSLAEVDIRMGESENEDMLSVGFSAYGKNTGMTRRDYPSYEAVRAEHALNDSELQALVVNIHFAPDIDREWDEDDLEEVVPKLYAKFG